MPNYEFRCEKCSVVFEKLVSYDEKDVYPTVTCPKCGSTNKKKLCSSFAFLGSSDMRSNSHDYRYKEQQPKLREQREMAEQMSHMGANPYNEIDDISSGENFGDVK